MGQQNCYMPLGYIRPSLTGQTFKKGRERLVTVVDFPCAITECCDYQLDCSSHVTI